MKNVTLKKLNSIIGKKYPNVEIVKGSGYFYLFSQDITTLRQLLSIESTSINTYRLNMLTEEQWMTEVDRIMKQVNS